MRRSRILTASTALGAFDLPEAAVDAVGIELSDLEQIQQDSPPEGVSPQDLQPLGAPRSSR